MIPTRINGRWELLLPEHRARRSDWVTGWERERLDSMHALLEPGMVLYDIGTEEGDLSALFAQWVSGGRIERDGMGTVISVGEPGGVVLAEPNPRVWPNVRAIWEANDVAPPLGVVDGFVADENRGDPVRATWPESAYGPLIGDHGFCRPEERPDLGSVTLDTLATVVPPPDAITMDVEGSELLVLRGGADVLTRHRPIIWISVHPEFMAYHYGQDESELHALMRAAGYHSELLAYDHEHHWVFVPEERA